MGSGGLVAIIKQLGWFFWVGSMGWGGLLAIFFVGLIGMGFAECVIPWVLFWSVSEGVGRLGHLV